MTLVSLEGATKTYLLHMSTENSGNSENIAKTVGHWNRSTWFRTQDAFSLVTCSIKFWNSITEWSGDKSDVGCICHIT